MGTTSSQRQIITSQAQQALTLIDFGKLRRDLAASFPDALIPTKPHHPPEEFHLFPKFPVELQLQVWRYVLDDIPYRVVPLWPGYGDIPGIVHACRTSRSESRKRFDICVSQRQEEKGEGDHRAKRYLLIDFRADVLYLATEPVPGLLEETTLQPGACSFRDCMKDIRSLALGLAEASAALSLKRIAAKSDLWTLLPTVCPLLVNVSIVVSGPPEVGDAAKERGLDGQAISRRLRFNKLYLPIRRWRHGVEEKVMATRLERRHLLARGQRPGWAIGLDFVETEAY